MLNEGGQIFSTPFAGKWLKFSKALCFAVDPSDLAGHWASERDKGKEREGDDGDTQGTRGIEGKKRIEAQGWEKKEQGREENRNASLLIKWDKCEM